MKNEIKIPFNNWSKGRVENLSKRATSRTKIYGNEGDYFVVNNKEFLILAIIKLPTNYIIKFLYSIEGAFNPEELRKQLNKIFRGNKLPNYLYTHFFIEVRA